ncbi:MAG: hypothetical protein ABDK87_03775, partial [Atribacterota bacterium]
YAIYRPDMATPLEKGLFKDICKEISDALRKKGYQEVAFPDSESSMYPDFVIIVVFSWEVEWVYQPPISIFLPRYNPGQSIDISGRVTQFGSGFSTYYFDASLYTRGYWTSEQITIPARYKDYYVPRVLIAAYRFDLDNPVLLWQGMAYKYVAKSKGEPQKYLRLTVKDLIEKKFPSIKKK